MSFTSYYFWGIFLPVSILIYWAFSKHIRLQNVVLMFISSLFYMLMNPEDFFVIWICIFITYFGAIYGSRVREKNDQAGKNILIAVLAMNIFMLCLFKYANSIGLLFCSKDTEIPSVLRRMPVGLSFYIFTSSDYLISVIRNKVKPEKNIVSYAIYVLFFPTIISGPIKKAELFLPQISRRKVLDFAKVEKALFLYLWGMALKMIVADRLSLFTETVFNHYNIYGSEILLLAIISYTIQLYADFCGYSYMAFALAWLFGYTVNQNFCRPYLARNIKEFWRRWHISLTRWLTENIYIPMGGSRKGKLRKYINIMTVFLISGIWHGVGFNYVFWGVLHGTYQILGDVLSKPGMALKRKMGLNPDSITCSVLQHGWLLFEVSFAWLFFRMPHIGDAIRVIQRILTVHMPWTLFDYSLTSCGLSLADYHVLFAALLIMFFVEWNAEKGTGLKTVLQQPALVRICIISVMIMCVIIFGIYGPAYSAVNFIYARF